MIHSIQERPLFFLILFSASLLLMSACEEEELKEPIRVDFRFEADPELGVVAGNGQGGGNASKHLLDVESGRVSLELIRVTGERKEGEDIDFEREERIDVPLDGSGSESTYFDLPQGTYKELNLELKVTRENGEAVLLEGDYTKELPNQPPEIFPFRFSSKTEKLIKLGVEDRNGNREIHLQKGNERLVRVEIELKKWFQGIGVGIWNNASTQTGQSGVEKLPLSNAQNQQLYSKILVRIPNAFKARIL